MEKHVEKKFDILCLGVGCYDVVVQHVPTDMMSQEYVVIDDITSTTGGDALNATVDLTRLGMKAGFLTVLGTDPWGKSVYADLERKGVDTSAIQLRDDFHSCVSYVLVQKDGERHFAINVEENMLPLYNKDIPDELIASTRHIHAASCNSLGSMDDELDVLFRRAHELGVTTSMDTGWDPTGRWFERIRETLKHCDIFFPSHYEAVEYCGGETDVLKMKEFFRNTGIKIFGCKLGAEGIFVTDYKEDIFMKPLFRGQPVDTTGAGDAFCSTFVAGIVRGMSLRDAAVLGQAQSAHIISALGANNGATDIHTLVQYAKGFGYEIDIKE
ncbi:MAG: carbohydrate kinase family protein [Clostridia bacterium]|nr:carbohydrate kinase family protein [Clostridia bacterium]